MDDAHGDISRLSDMNRRTLENQSKQTFITPFEPVTKEITKTFSFPESIWAREDLGSPTQFIEYVRESNRIPITAAFWYELDDKSGELQIKYIWWEVTFDGNNRKSDW